MGYPVPIKDPSLSNTAFLKGPPYHFKIPALGELLTLIPEISETYPPIVHNLIN